MHAGAGEEAASTPECMTTLTSVKLVDNGEKLVSRLRPTSYQADLNPHRQDDLTRIGFNYSE